MATGTLTNTKYPNSGYPGSQAELRKQLGGRHALYRFLENLAWRDVVVWFDDFNVRTLNADPWALANSGGTGVANLAINTQESGVARMATGTTSAGSVSVIGPVIYTGNRYAWMEARLKVDTVTSYNLEVGFIDAVPGSNGSGVSDVDTPAATMANGALLQIDTSQTLTTLAFVTAGNDTSQVVKATTCTGTTVFTAATFLTVRIAIIGANAYCWVNGKLEASHQDAAGNVNKATLLAPWFYAKTSNTTTKNVDVDYVRVQQFRQ